MWGGEIKGRWNPKNWAKGPKRVIWKKFLIMVNLGKKGLFQINRGKVPHWGRPNKEPKPFQTSSN